MPWALMHPHTITEAGFCTFRLDGLLSVLFLSLLSILLPHLWYVESDIRFSQKQAEMWTCLTREHVFRSISDDFGPREHLNNMPFVGSLMS